ncbi:MAG TPA: GNAT family N-acetyltransferase [Kofleriaceae bacterium]|jgi:phosphinothricin acetyltransferase|nr:GNAT family N-acetyltransferase [Kofleriaceae bacterium]
MAIRAARADDFAAIAAITNHYITTSAIHFAYEPVSEDDLRGMWDRHRDRHPWLVTEDDMGVLGYAKSGVWRDRAAYNWTCEVGLYIADHARGRGLGFALYVTLLGECQRRGFRSAVAGITLPNEPSIKLHERCGFQRVGTFEDAGWKNGAWHAVEFWQKRFSMSPEGPQ